MIQTVAKKVGAYHLCDISDSAGLIASELAPSPFDSADAVVCSPFATLRGPRGAAMIFYRSAFASNVDGAVFPGHQGGPHNHAISAMATSLKMAQSEEFKGYQQRVQENANTMESALKEKGWDNVHVLGNNGHCVGIRGMQNMDTFHGVADKVNIQMLHDTVNGEVRMSSNAMTTRGMDTEEFKSIIDRMDDIKALSDKVAQHGYDACNQDISALKRDIAGFA